jgi:Na+/melibiose symporter-like transporter
MMAAPVLEHVPILKKLAYAAPAFALAVVGIPIYVYLPKFYTDVVGIEITALGFILASVRIFDAVTDPPHGIHFRPHGFTLRAAQALHCGRRRFRGAVHLPAVQSPGGLAFI